MYLRIKYFGFQFINNKLVFTCPCNSIVSHDHTPCKKYYSKARSNNHRAFVSVTVSKFITFFSCTAYKIFDPNGKELLSNLKLNLILVFGIDYFVDNIFVKRYYLYIKLSRIMFKFSYNKKYLVNQLVINNESTINIDRNNINIKNSKNNIKTLFTMKNPYYFQFLNQQLKNKIGKAYNNNNKYKNYEIHEYEKRNKIPIPTLSPTANPTSSQPIITPSIEVRNRMKVFIQETQSYTIPVPTAPPSFDPFDIKHTIVLDDYFKHEYKGYTAPPPTCSYKEKVSDIEAKFPNKKYLFYEDYKNIQCYFCKKKGHPVRWCEETVDIESCHDPDIRRLAYFIYHYPRCYLAPKFGNYSQLITELPQEFQELRARCLKFWKDFGYINPFADLVRFWAFGDCRRRDVGYLWAIGAPRVYLLKLVIGYETKYCINVPRMQFENHKSYVLYADDALPLIHEQLANGILRFVPPEAVENVLPMAVIKKLIPKLKVRIVNDAKPTNVYVPAMKFKPESIEVVKQTMFHNARVLTQDGRNAFYQLPVTKRQALKQCIRFFYKPFQKICYAAYGVEIFGSSNSCYRFAKMDQQINNYFKGRGIQLNSLYDDSIFYAPDHPLYAGTTGSFVKRVYCCLGRQLNEDKTDLLVGKKEVKFRGFLWNTSTLTFQPLPKLLNSTSDSIQQIIDNGDKLLPIKQLVSVMGKLSYMTTALHYMSILLSPCKDLMRKLHRKYDAKSIWKKHCVVPVAVRKHFMYLKNIVENHHTAYIIVPNIDYEIVTDASDRIAASYDSDGKVVVIPLSSSIKNLSSTYREVYGGYVALLNRVSKLKNKNVRLLIDNLGSSTILMRNGSKIHLLNQLVYRLIKLCQDNNINLWVRWLRRDVQAIRFADDLSKTVEKDRWIFDRNLFDYILLKLKLPLVTLDLLADYDNKLVDRYFSRYNDSFSVGNNWMKKSYKYFDNEVCYLNPPFRGDYLALSIEQIIMKQINTYVILPLWVSASWYNRAVQHAQCIVIIPNGSSYFQSPS